MRTKRELAIYLSKLKVFENPNWKLEQYPTDSDVAADIIWHAHLIEDLNDKIVVDLGCGTGILGIAALIAGAKKVFFVEIDEKALDIAKQNHANVAEEYELGEAVFIHQDAREFHTQGADVVLENPPFGIKDEHADRKFLARAFELAPVIYTLHKSESTQFINSFSDDSSFKVTDELRYQFPLKQTMDYHKKRIHRIPVTCYRLEKVLIK